MKWNQLFFEIQQANHALIHSFQGGTVHWSTSGATQFSKRLLLWWCLFKCDQGPKKPLWRTWQRAPLAVKQPIWSAGKKCSHNRRIVSKSTQEKIWMLSKFNLGFTREVHFSDMDANRLHYLHFFPKTFDFMMQTHQWDSLTDWIHLNSKK